MKYWIRIFYFFLLLLCLKSPLAAQTYPIQVNTVLMPPASPYLSHYYNAMVPKLQVHINFVDFNKPITQARLRIRISSNNLQIQSKPRALTSILELMPGSPLMLQGMDLMEYFDIRNLDLPVFIAQTGKLPAGMYRFCFWLEDLHTNRPISNPNLGCSYAYIALGKPPLLNLPKNNEQVAFREPVNLFFQWTPQHLSMAGAMMFTEYEFILKELWDKERSPEAGFASTPEFYSETVKVPFLYYGAAHPLLMPGKRYAWAVRAKLAPGYEDAAEFVNKGFSEIRSFVFQPDCKVPSSCKTQILNDKEVLFRWQGAGFDKRYKVEYAENGISNGYSKEVEGEETVTLRGFKKGRSYQYRVGEFCMQSMDYVFSNPHSFEIPKDIKKREFNCGLLPPDLNITNRKAITELLENDEITAAGFPISLTRVSGQKKFSGEGYVSIPMLGYANVKVRFSNIQVNTDYQLIDGFIETTYDPEGKQVVSTDTLQQALAELKDQLELIIKEIEFVIGGTENIQVTENPEALTDSTASKYIIEVEGINGEKTQVAVDSLPLVLEDAEGNQYEVGTESITQIWNSIFKKQVFIIEGERYKNKGEYVTFYTGKELEIQIGGEKTSVDLSKISWHLNGKQKDPDKDSIHILTLRLDKIELPHKVNSLEVKDSNNTVFLKINILICEEPTAYFSLNGGYPGHFLFDDGFRNYPALQNSRYYDTLTVKNKIEYAPVLALNMGNTAELNLSIEKEGKKINNTNFYIVLRASELNKVTLNAQLDSLVIKGDEIAATKGAYFDKKINIKAKEYIHKTELNPIRINVYLQPGDSLIGRLQYYCAPKIKKKLTLIFVKFQDESFYPSYINKTELQTYLNTKIMNQLFIEFEVDTLQHSSKMSKSAFQKTQTADTIRDALNMEKFGKTIPENYSESHDYFYITNLVIPRGEGYYLSGNHLINEPGGIQLSEPRDPNSVMRNHDYYGTMAHELGHFLGLIHPFESLEHKQPQVTNAGGQTLHSIMDYFVERKSWFAFHLLNANRIDFNE